MDEELLELLEGVTTTLELEELFEVATELDDLEDTGVLVATELDDDLLEEITLEITLDDALEGVTTPAASNRNCELHQFLSIVPDCAKPF